MKSAVATSPAVRRPLPSWTAGRSCGQRSPRRAAAIPRATRMFDRVRVVAYGDPQVYGPLKGPLEIGRIQACCHSVGLAGATTSATVHQR